MPTLIRIGPYRFFFYSRDCDEPRHIHAGRDAAQAKFWLEPVRLEHSSGFRAAELRKLERLVKENEPELIGGWDAYCD